MIPLNGSPEENPLNVINLGWCLIQRLEFHEGIFLVESTDEEIIRSRDDKTWQDFVSIDVANLEAFGVCLHLLKTNENKDQLSKLMLPCNLLVDRIIINTLVFHHGFLFVSFYFFLFLLQERCAKTWDRSIKKNKKSYSLRRKKRKCCFCCCCCCCLAVWG